MISIDRWILDRKIDGQIDKWIDGQIYGQKAKICQAKVLITNDLAKNKMQCIRARGQKQIVLDRQIDKQIDLWIDRYIDGQIDRYIDRQLDLGRQIYRQIQVDRQREVLDC